MLKLSVHDVFIEPHASYSRKLRDQVTDAEERETLLLLVLSLVSRLAPRCVVVTCPRDCNAAGTYLHNVALPISRTRTCHENDLPTARRGESDGSRRTLQRDNNRAPGPPSARVSGSRNHRTAVLNSILYNRFVVR